MGTAAELQAAIDSGEVEVRTNDRGIKLYYFPTDIAGEKESAEKDITFSRGKATTNKAMTDVGNELLASLGWDFGVGARAINKAGSASSSGNDKMLEVAKEKLDKAYLDMQKASKLTSKILNDAENVDVKSSRLVSTSAELSTLHETLESVMADLSFLLKFKKTKGGQHLSPQVAQNVLQMCAKVLQDVLDVTKQTKSLLPEVKTKEKPFLKHGRK